VPCSCGERKNIVEAVLGPGQLGGVEPELNDFADIVGGTALECMISPRLLQFPPKCLSPKYLPIALQIV
jgi:hypothetical protein